MKFYPLIFILNVIASCGENKVLHNYTVTKYQKVNEGYQYSKDLLKYERGTYKPVASSDYLNDTLTTVTVYKSEGSISYSKIELQEDTLFKQTLALPEIRKVETMGANLTDNGKSYKIEEVKRDSIFSIDHDTLMLYIIK